MKCFGLRAMLSVLAVLATACADRAFPQAFTANLTGLLTDPQNAVMPRVVVKLQSTTTQQTRQTMTGSEGRYTFSQLLPSVYELTAEVPGFRTFVQKEIRLIANQTAELNIQMTLGEVTQVVEISAAAPLLDSQTANQSVTLEQRAIADLPINAPNPFVLVHATAGVVAVRTGISQATQDQNHNRFALNGGRDESSLILLDGVPATTGDWSALIIAPAVLSVQEVQVVRNSYEAQFGKSGGGVVSLVTKSGSNNFHGTVFESLRNGNLDANSWDRNRTGQPKPKLQRNIFGGNFSGPLWRSQKLFFFAGYEALRLKSPASTTSTVPTPGQRQGDFSETRNPNGTLSAIHNPFTTRPNPSGAGFIRDPFEGNRIPQNLLDPIGARAVGLYPQPRSAGDAITNARNFFASSKTVTTNDRFDARIDWARSERHQFYVRVSKAWQENVAPVYFGNNADSNFSDQNPRHHFTIGNTFIPDPTWVVNVLIGSGRWREEQDSPSKDLDGTRIGFPASLVSGFAARTIPQFNLDAYATLGNARFLNLPRETHNLQANVTKERGVHSLKFGFAVESAKLNNTDVRSADFNFNRGMTSGPIAATTSSTSGNSIASLLLGAGSGGSAPDTVRPASNQMYYALYFQDSWRVNRRLTLNYGLRYEVQKARTERFNRFSYFDFDVANPLGQRAGLPLRGGLTFVTAQNRSLWDTDRVDLAPRLGIAYKLTDKLVVRTGYGIFYPQTVGAGAIPGTDGFTTRTAWVASRGDDGINPNHLLRNPFPDGLNKPVGSSQGLETLVGESITGWQRPHPSGYIQQYSLDFQYEIGRDLLVELGYAGNQSRKLVYGVSINANQLPSNLLSQGAALDQQVSNPFFGHITSGALAGRTVPRHRLLRPYPQFINVSLPVDTPGASASYNAMLAKVSKRFSGGLSLLATYQWSKSIDNASETQGWELSEAFRDFNNLSNERSISGHDVPHSWVTALVYELPVGKGKKFGSAMHPVADFLVGGWQVSTITSFSHGLPLQVTAPNTNGVYGFGAQRPNIANLKNLEVPTPVPDRWFNTGAFSPPPVYTVGNAPRWFPNLRFGATRHSDIALLKRFRFRDRIETQFRAEFFNGFNRPQFGRADTNLASGSFGRVSGTTNVGPRNIQFGLRIGF